MIETLRDAFETEPTRKCFRLVGGVLVERTVADVLPELESQLQQVRVLLLEGGVELTGWIADQIDYGDAVEGVQEEGACGRELEGDES